MKFGIDCYFFFFKKICREKIQATFKCKNIVRLTQACRVITNPKYLVHAKVLCNFVSLSIELVFISLDSKSGNKSNINTYKSHKIFEKSTASWSSVQGL